MKVALYGGTFDPIHHGHLIVARDALKVLGLDRVLFIPAAQSPLKPGVATTPAELRLEMVRAAIEGEEQFDADDLEISKGGTSYSFDTVHAVHLRWPGA